MPFGSVVIWSNSAGSLSSATAVANPLLPLHGADFVSDEEACESPRDSGRTVRGRNMSCGRECGCTDVGPNCEVPTKFRDDEARHVRQNRCGGNTMVNSLEPHTPGSRLLDNA
jgi:hypothetical protein